MRVDEYDFELPDANIALRPASPRDAARMLVVRTGEEASDHIVRDLPRFLRKGDVLVVNDTRVIAAELHGERIRESSSAGISVNLIRRIDASRWQALARGAKKIATGDRVRFGSRQQGACLVSGLDATVTEKGEGGLITLSFDLSAPVLDEAIAAIGQVPLPPYIAGRRAADETDRHDYQTIFAREEGAVAAPTAGLHFTEELLAELDALGVRRETVTLHVGAGTFLPVKVDDTADHQMHAEWGRISAATADALNEARAAGGRIIAVGTTSLRLLESAADEDGSIRPFADETSIFITPGYRFRAVDVLMTNFHLPRSTLFMLVCAFAGLSTMRAAYAAAITRGYRFYSYGDTSLLHRAEVS